MAFIKVGTLGRFGGPLLVERIITNSATVAVGDAVKTTAGFGALVTTGDDILGVVESVIGADGLAVSTGGTYRGNPGDAFTAASDNQTVARARVRVDVDMSSLYEGLPDAAIGTTAGSGLAGKTFDLVDEDNIDESTVNETKQQVYSHGPSINDTTRLVINILESELFGM
jgi:hypothetical protein